MKIYFDRHKNSHIPFKCKPGKKQVLFFAADFRVLAEDFWS
jgi:hypothetical protein